MRALTMVLGACVLATGAVGCGFYGDSTWGEENRSTWRIDDGLCPGTEGGCGMETPVAAGVELSVDADVPCAVRRRDSRGDYYSECPLESFDVSAAGVVEMRDVSYDVADARIDIEVFTLEPGEGVIELDEYDVGPFDRITFDVREAADIECGRVGESGAQWDMPSLDTSGSYTAQSSGADRESSVELGCRLLDERGLPLFSGSAIHWRILEGGDIANIDDGGLFGGNDSSGARIYVRIDVRGTIRLEARFGDMTRELEVVVE